MRRLHNLYRGDLCGLPANVHLSAKGRHRMRPVHSVLSANVHLSAKGRHRMRPVHSLCFGQRFRSARRTKSFLPEQNDVRASFHDALWPSGNVRGEIPTWVASGEAHLSAKGRHRMRPVHSFLSANMRLSARNTKSFLPEQNDVRASFHDALVPHGHVRGEIPTWVSRLKGLIP